MYAVVHVPAAAVPVLEGDECDDVCLVPVVSQRNGSAAQVLSARGGGEEASLVTEL